MRPADILYRYNPEQDPGVDAMRRQLPSRGNGAPPEVLGPVSALKELKAICDSMVAGRGGPNVGNRASLINDLQLSLESLGGSLRSGVGPVLEKFRHEIGQTKARLDSPQGARLIALALGSLLERFDRPEAARGAWRDARKAFQDHDASAELCQLRILQLAEIAELRGHDWSERARFLSGVLSDDPASLLQAGELDERSYKRRIESDSSAGVAEWRRLELCEEAVMQPAAASDVVVWLVIDGAAIEGGYLPVGRVQFIDQSLIPEALRAGGDLERRDDFDPPPELEDWDVANVALGLKYLTDAEHRLLARVEIKETTPPRARARAREVVQGMIDLAETHSPWMLLDGAISWNAKTGGWAGTMFGPPIPISEQHRAVHPVFQATGRNLGGFSPSFVDRLLAGGEAEGEAMQDALWTVSVERAAAAPQRIVLATRALERGLSRARAKSDDTWAEPAARFLRAPWMRYTLYGDLMDAASAALYLMPDRDGANAELFRELHDRLFPEMGPGSRSFDLAQLKECLARAAPVLPNGSMQHRLARDALAIVSDGKSATTAVAALDRRFQRLLGRAERQRNALTHGTGTDDAVVETVDSFATLLTRLVAQEATRQATTGQQPLVELEKWRAELTDVESTLTAGTEPTEFIAWVDPAPPT